MKLTRWTATLALLILTAACASRPSPGRQPLQSSTTPTARIAHSEVPLLYVVDGVRQPLDQVPVFKPGDVASVRVVKGRAALLEYGPDASYGVVLVTTRTVAASR